MQPMTSDGLALLAYARRGVERAWRDGYGPEDVVACVIFADHAFDARSGESIIVLRGGGGGKRHGRCRSEDDCDTVFHK